MYEFLQYKVKDAMTPAPITTTPDTPLLDVEKIFETHDFNGVPVVDNAGQLVGLVTKFDLLKAFMLTPETPVPRYNSIMEHTVESVMRRDPVTVTPDLPLSRLLQQLIEMGVKSFPVVQVVDNDRLVGIISREDVLKALRRATEDSPPIQEA
jgi:CBS domain-containing protein